MASGAMRPWKNGRLKNSLPRKVKEIAEAAAGAKQLRASPRGSASQAQARKRATLRKRNESTEEEQKPSAGAKEGKRNESRARA